MLKGLTNIHFPQKQDIKFTLYGDYWKNSIFIKNIWKQGPQGPLKLSSLKWLKIQLIEGIFTPTSEMASLLNSGWQNRKERPNRSTHSVDMVKRATRPVSEWVFDIYPIIVKLSF